MKVFISYSHSNHTQRAVIALSERLRNDGIDCEIDLYNPNPIEGWQKWMDDQIEHSKFVLVVADENYYEKSRSITNFGKGVKFETTLTYAELYHSNSKNDKFIPIVFKNSDIQYIPKPLKAFTFYNLESEVGYENIYRRITNQPKILKPKLGQIKDLNFKTIKSSTGEKFIKSLGNLPNGNEVVEGKLIEIRNHEAIFEIGEYTGYLNIEEISYDEINHPSEVLKLGQKLNVVVIRKIEIQKLLILSLKRLQPEPIRIGLTEGEIVTVDGIEEIQMVGNNVGLFNWGNGIKGQIKIKNMEEIDKLKNKPLDLILDEIDYENRIYKFIK